MDMSAELIITPTFNFSRSFKLRAPAEKDLLAESFTPMTAGTVTADCAFNIQLDLCLALPVIDELHV